ncbi:MAG: hypothetical protein JWM05_1410 [Acidimicrobiales bacterium]|nr:hypothetical protein [Acidimicrobiales bacterium]
MAWLLRDGEVLASLQIASSHRSRACGLLGRDGMEGALLIERTRSVHTVGMRFPLDIAFCDRDMVVLRAVTVPRNRVTRPVLRSRGVLEAEAGSFARWGLVVGDQLEVDGR